MKKNVKKMMALAAVLLGCSASAFAQDGFVLYVPKNVQIERPIQLINMMHADFDLLATSRNLIILEENASTKVIICNTASLGISSWQTE